MCCTAEETSQNLLKKQNNHKQSQSIEINDQLTD